MRKNHIFQLTKILLLSNHVRLLFPFCYIVIVTYGSIYNSLPSGGSRRVFGDISTVTVPGQASWSGTALTSLVCPFSGNDDICVFTLVAQPIYTDQGITTTRTAQLALLPNIPQMGTASVGIANQNTLQVYEFKTTLTTSVAFTITILRGAIDVYIKYVNLTATPYNTGYSPIYNSYNNVIRNFRSGDVIPIASNTTARRPFPDIVIAIVATSTIVNSVTAVWSISNQLYLEPSTIINPLYVQPFIPMTVFVGLSASRFVFTFSITRRACNYIMNLTPYSASSVYGWLDVTNRTSGAYIFFDTDVDDYGSSPYFALTDLKYLKGIVDMNAFLPVGSLSGTFSIVVSNNCSRSDTATGPALMSFNHYTTEESSVHQQIPLSEHAAIQAARTEEATNLFDMKESGNSPKSAAWMEEERRWITKRMIEPNAPPSEMPFMGETNEIAPPHPAHYPVYDMSKSVLSDAEANQARAEAFKAAVTVKDWEELAELNHTRSPAHSNSSRHLLSLTDSPYENHHRFQIEGIFDGTQSFEEIFLRAGYSQTGYMSRSYGWVRYTYRPINPAVDVVFNLVRNTGGDPNIYVNGGFVSGVTTANLGLPTPSAATWKSEGLGTDLLVINSNDANICLTNGCVYHALVRCIGRPCDYTLTVTEGDGITPLVPGVASRGYLTANIFEYYSLEVSQPDVNITFTLTNLAGQVKPTMYVREGLNTSAPWVWSTAIPAASQFVTLTLSRAANPATPGPYKYTCTPNRVRNCFYTVAIQASANTTISLLGNTNGIIRLTAGIPQEGSLYFLSQTLTYSFSVSRGYGSASLSLGQIFGAVDVYLSRTATPPTPGIVGSYIGLLLSTDVIRALTITEAQGCELGVTNTTCMFTVLVVNRALRSDMAILVSVGRTSYPLVSGIPTPVTTLRFNQSNFYWIKVDADANSHTALTVMSGTISIAYTIAQLGQMDVPYPPLTNSPYTLSPINPGAVVVFVNSYFYIGVYNLGPYDASYTVMTILTEQVANDTSTQALRTGIPQFGWLYWTQQYYYSYTLSVYNPLLTFSLWARAGPDVNLYATYSTLFTPAFPSPQYSMWRSNTNSSDVIQIYGAFAGTYYLSVRCDVGWYSRGSANSQYILTASQYGTFLQLQNNIPQVGYGIASLPQLYSFYNSMSNNTVKIELTALSGNP